MTLPADPPREWIEAMDRAASCANGKPCDILCGPCFAIHRRLSPERMTAAYHALRDAMSAPLDAGPNAPISD